MRKLILNMAIAIVASGAIAAAQDIESKTKTKITVKDGKDVTVTGCIARSADGAYKLTNVANKDGVLPDYLLVPGGEDDLDLDERIGHRVEIKGKAADKGDGKVKIESRSEVGTTGGDTRKRESKTEVEGDLHGLPYLGVKSIRMLATVCP
jgi:hypothetical protein